MLEDGEDTNQCGMSLVEFVFPTSTRESFFSVEKANMENKKDETKQWESRNRNESLPKVEVLPMGAGALTL